MQPSIINRIRAPVKMFNEFYRQLIEREIEGLSALGLFRWMMAFSRGPSIVTTKSMDEPLTHLSENPAGGRVG